MVLDMICYKYHSSSEASRGETSAPGLAPASTVSKDEQSQHLVLEWSSGVRIGRYIYSIQGWKVDGDEEACCT